MRGSGAAITHFPCPVAASHPVRAGLATGRRGSILFFRPTSDPENFGAVSGAERRTGTPGPLPAHLGHRQGKKFGKALPHP